MTSFFRFVNKLAIYRLDIISLAHHGHNYIEANEANASYRN